MPPKYLPHLNYGSDLPTVLSDAQDLVKSGWPKGGRLIE